MRFRQALPAFCALVALVSACGSKEPPVSETPLIDLAKSDYEALRAGEPISTASYDRATGGLFSKAFGGRSRANVAQYLDQRVRLILSYDQEAEFQYDPPGPLSLPWLQDGPSRLVGTAKDSEQFVGGENIGSLLFFAGRVADETVSFIFRDRTIPVVSSRVGIIELGRAYDRVPRAGTDETVPLVQPVRQATLVHEARHSDCTGGPAERELALARKATSFQDFSARAAPVRCGHLHAICPESVPNYAGYAACDREPYGAYGIEALFMRAMLARADLSTTEYNQLEILSSDAQSRVIGFSGGLDMSSSDVAP